GIGRRRFDPRLPVRSCALGRRPGSRHQPLDGDEHELLGNEAIRHEVARYAVKRMFNETRLRQILIRLEHEKNGEELVAQLRSEAVAKLEQFLETPLGRVLWRAANR